MELMMMKVEGRYAQVFDTSHECNHERLDAIVDDGWQMIQCASCLKRWDSLGKRRSLSDAVSVIDEVHDFQRFDRVTLNRSGGVTSRELKVVCRCGWSSTSHDRNPDEDAAIAAARTRLQEHVDDMNEYARRRT